MDAPLHTIPASDSRFPAWLLVSGLPQSLAAAHGPAPWPVFRAIVEADCAQNPTQPGQAEVAIDTIAASTGLATDDIHASIDPLRAAGLIKCHIADDDEEPSMFEVLTPLPVAGGRAAIVARRPDICETCLRYLDPPPADVPPESEALEIIIDEYLNTCGLALSHAVIERLQRLAVTYPLDLVRREFKNARRDRKRSLALVEGAVRYAGGRPTGKPAVPKSVDWVPDPGFGHPDDSHLYEPRSQRDAL